MLLKPHYEFPISFVSIVIFCQMCSVILDLSTPFPLTLTSSSSTNIPTYPHWVGKYHFYKDTLTCIILHCICKILSIHCSLGRNTLSQMIVREDRAQRRHHMSESELMETSAHRQQVFISSLTDRSGSKVNPSSFIAICVQSALEHDTESLRETERDERGSFKAESD